MTSPVLDEEWREQAARVVAKARDFGQKYFMLPDGTLVLREDHEKWVREEQEMLRRSEEYRFQRDIANLHSKPWGVIIVFGFGLVGMALFILFH